MNIKLLALAAACTASLASVAGAQVPMLVNGDLETEDPFLSMFSIIRPQGWRIYNYGEYRWVGDGLTPMTQVHAGTHSCRLPGGEGRVGGEFEGIHAEEHLDLNNVNSPYNWPQYTFDPVNGAPIKVSCWFMIPADDPMVKSRFGMKACFHNDPGPLMDNFGHFYCKEQLSVDPEAAMPFPGCTFVTVNTPQGPQPGIHTNGQWLKFEMTINQQTDFPATIDDPPPNPARSTMLALRFDIFPPGGTPAPVSYGSVWVDDMAYEQVTTPACPADFNGMDGLTVQDIFDFLNAWFAGNPSADFNGTGGISVQDIFDFLNAWFAGCP